MVKKILGYVLAIIGILAISASSIDQIRAPLAPYIPLEISNNYLLIGGIALAVIGIFLVLKSPRSRKQKSVEVPIYHGKNIVGYRRT